MDNFTQETVPTEFSEAKGIHARRRNDGDVRWNAVRAPAHLWITMGGKRISSR